ncbi:MAG: hypothetical protein RLZZ103_587 [Pseudomonadota bacterium]|jgi:hypothetical protein
MDTNLPGRIFEVIPFVEDGPPVNPSITVTHRMPPTLSVSSGSWRMDTAI